MTAQLEEGEKEEQGGKLARRKKFFSAEYTAPGEEGIRKSEKRGGMIATLLYNGSGRGPMVLAHVECHYKVVLLWGFEMAGDIK